MKIKDAIDHLLKTDHKWLDEHKSVLKIGTLEIPWRLLIENDWRTAFISTDPKFNKDVKDLIEVLKESGPMAIEGDDVHSLN